MKKIIMVAGVFCLLFLAWSVQDGRSKEQPVYSGDAVYYKNRVVIATAVSGQLDFYTLAGEHVTRLFSVSLSSNPSKTDVFNDVKLDIQGDKLMAYAVAGYAVYQYDVSNLYSAELKKSVKNTYWEWYDRFGGNIGTVSRRGITILNSDLDVIDRHDFVSDFAYSVRSGGSARFISLMNESSISVYDRETRQLLTTTPLNFTNYTKNGRKPHYDRVTNDTFVIDDYYVKKIDINGVLTASYRHGFNSSYDVESTVDNQYVYASNGLKVMKLKKSDLSLVGETLTTTMGAAQGWAMGLKLVVTPSGDRLIVFNGTSILVLDSNLKLLANAGHVSKEDNIVTSRENLYLMLDHSNAVSGASVNLQGGGFWPDEDLQIKLANSVVNAKANRLGKFNISVPVPSVAAGRYDIKVDGQASKLTYSISFTIVK